MKVIGPCLESVLSQDFGLPFEILVHDDASTDDSVAFIREQFPSITLITSSENVGYCVSNNRMASLAKGRFILLLNNDATLHKDAIRTLHSYATSLKTSAILSLPQYNMQTQELVDIGSLLDIFFNPVPNTDTTRRRVGMVIGACLWIPKLLWEELGGFPEWFGSIAEDLYLCCLARLRGYPVIALPESGFDHWEGRSFGGGKVTNNTLHTTYRRRALSERNKIYVMLLCCPYPYSLFIIPLHLAMLAFEGTLVSLLKMDMRIFKEIYMNSLSQAWDNRKKLIRHRRQLQKTQNRDGAFFDSFVLIPSKLTMFRRYGLPHVG
jgi:GT2 family glycosyltransferase